MQAFACIDSALLEKRNACLETGQFCLRVLLNLIVTKNKVSLNQLNFQRVKSRTIGPTFFYQTAN